MILDENYGYVALATNTNGNAVPLKVDPVTGRLLIEIVVAPEVARTLNRALVDENYASVSQAVDDNAEIVPLLIDNRNGFLLVDIEM